MTKVQFPAEQDFYHNIQSGSEAYPGVLTSGVKWPVCEANHFPPSSAMVKNAWSYTSTPPYICIGKHQGQLYLYLKGLGWLVGWLFVCLFVC
jgi:hypothetical protein